MKKYKTVIIGSGISGLACAKTLFDAGYTDFKVIGKRVGGRMLTSKSFTINYGASYITSEYKNVSRFIHKGDPLKLNEIYFIQGKKIANVFSWSTIPLIPKFIKMAYLINEFANRLDRLRKRALEIGQKKALLEDDVLVKYTEMSAEEFVKKHKIEKLHKVFFEPVLVSTAFTTKSNAFYYLGVLIPIIRKVWDADFMRTVLRMTKGFPEKVKKGIVTSVKKQSNGKIIIKTNKTKYEVDNVVIAVPHKQAHKFYPVPKTGKSIAIYVLHVIGKREEIYRKKKIIFFKTSEHDITILWRQHTGSDIIFSLIKNPDLDKYYKYHYVVKKIFWNNALAMSGPAKTWASHKLEKNIWLASDYNICGLEDSFLTGVYTAKQILKQQ